MIALSLAEIAEVVGGRVLGDASAVVTGVAVIDSRLVAEGDLFAALPGEHVDGHDYVVRAAESGAAASLVSRTVDVDAVLVDDVAAALALLARHVVGLIDADVIAVTGSQGKTSVKDLLAHVLEGVGPTVASQGSFNNELGVPLTVLRADASTRYLVVEMGARGVGHIRTLTEIAPPDVAVVLNVGHAHVGEFGSPEVTAQAKGELVEALDTDGVAVLNADDPRVNAMALRTSARVLTFGDSGNVHVEDLYLDTAGQPHFVLEHAGDRVAVHVPQIGAHHAINAAATAAAALAVGLDLTTVATRLADAAPRSAHRMARHERADGVVVLDDAYNANPESMTAAVRALAAVTATRRVAVLGPMFELGDESDAAHARIGALAAELGVDRVIAVGAPALARGAGERAIDVADVSAAVDDLSAWLTAGDVVLVKASRGARLERVVDALLAVN